MPLTSGYARLEVAPGIQAIVVVPANGAAPTKRTILITAGKESVVDVAGPAPTTTEPVEPEKPFPTKKVVGGVMIVSGIGLGVLAVQQALFYGELQDRGKEYAAVVPKDAKPCDPGTLEHFCNTDNRARTASTIAWVGGSVAAVLIGAGVYFAFLSGDSSSEKGATAKNKPPKPKTRFAPTFGGFALSGTF